MADLEKKLEEAWRAGDLKTSETHANALLKKDKNNSLALQFLAKFSLSNKNYKDAAKYWGRLAAVSPPHWEIFVGWAQAEEQNGDLEAAIAACLEGLKKLEGDFLILFVLGQLNQKAGYEKQATTAFFYTADIMARMIGSGDNQLKNHLKSFAPQFEFARNHLEKSLNAAFLKAVKKVGEKTKSQLGRVEQAKYVRFTRPPVTGDVLHQPQVFYMPSLTKTPWFKGGSFPFTKALEAEFKGLKTEILAEFRPNLDAKPVLGPHQNLSPALMHLADSRDWAFYPFYQRFEKNPEAEKRFPEAFEVLKSLPLYTLEGRVSEAGLTVIKPKIHIPGHFGLTNAALACHLPIVVPKESGIKVGGEEKPYEAGQPLIFDDTFIHEFWNGGDDPLILLTFHIWHPNVQGHEKEALAAGAVAENEWYQNRVYKTLFDE